MTSQVAILHYAAPPVVGGVESTIYHHARLLARTGRQVVVIAGRGESFDPTVEFHLIPHMDSRHLDVLSVGQRLAQGRVDGGFAALRDRLVQELRPLLSTAAVSIVHNAVTLHKNLALTAALRVLAEERVTRFIAWCHDFAWQDALYTSSLHAGYPWDLLRTPWPGVKYVVVSSHRRERLATLIGLAPDQIEVIYPGISVTELLKLESETVAIVDQLDLLAADPLLLLPARITRRKNIEFAVRVIAALCDTRPAARLLVTGPPGAHNPSNLAYLQSLQSLRDTLGVTNRVHFLYEHGIDGEPLYVTDAMMADFYKLADVLLFPSHREGFGIPVLEAALARIPVFAADIPSVRESAGGLAWLFDPEGDPTAVARMLAELLNRDRVYRLRRRVLEEFTWSKVLEKRLYPLIEEVERDG